MKKVFCVLLMVLVCGAALSAQQSAGLAFAQGPAILTSVGQSADLEMIRVLLTRNRIEFKMDALVKAEGLSASDKTLILVVGGSSKGLGAAGISAQDELNRSQALVRRARELNMKIIALHIGGESRRGSLSDEFIRFALPLADFVVAVSEGDNDGLLTSLTQTARIPFQKVNRISDVGTPLAAAFIR
jgi:hypothetical protein